MTNFILAFASRGTGGAVVFVLAFSVFTLSAVVISSALLLVDRKTIADFRRVSAALLAGDILWIIFATCGIVFAALTGSTSALSNAFLFGAFVSAGFGFLVIDGVFTERSWLAIVLAAINPSASFVILRYHEFSLRLGILPALLGVLAFAAIAAFTLLLRSRKTSRGYSVLSLFRAFMKTWVGGVADELEEIIAAHSEEAKVSTKVMRFQTRNSDLFLVLPGVHPGPFHPVGSYDLPGVISSAFKGQGAVMTLHRPGGHERNLATREGTERYANETRNYARMISPSMTGAIMKGPIRAPIGKANVGATAFSKDLLLTVSFAPLGSDDLNAEVDAALSGPASYAGFDAVVVDAHNSLADTQESIDSANPGWEELFERMGSAQATTFRVGYAHSSELGIGAREDLTEIGIGLVMFETPRGKSVLVLADSNNAVPPLRAEVAHALSPLGYELIEFCTSDSHNLAARGLTVSRGYKALGEATALTSIAKLVADIAKLAETRLSQCGYGSGVFTSSVRVFGSEALEEFATISLSTSRLAQRYLGVAVLSVAVLFVLSLVF